MNFTRLTRAATFVVASATLAHCVSGQSPTVLRDDNGSLVEFVGLKRWSLAMVVDSARKYAPKEKLTAHVCAEMFREQLRFPDAASFLFAGTPERWLVIVREPADSSRVRFRTVGSDTTNPSQALNYLGSGAQSNVALLQATVRLLVGDSLRSVEAMDLDSPADSAAAHDLSVRIRREHTAERWSAARHLLAASPNRNDRLTSVAVLSSFAENDESWNALMDAVRDADRRVSAFAASTLLVMSQRRPRTVEWKSGSGAIHAILDGTALFRLREVLLTLNSTGVSPKNAVAFLAGGGDLLVELAGSSQAYVADPSHALLVALRGQDMGRDPTAWRRWIQTLR